MKYRTTGAWGSGEGRRLTKEEIDQNFYELVQRLDTVEADIAAGGNPISMITSTGSALYLHMTSGAVFGPIQLPVIRWSDTGKWSAGTGYFTNDVFTVDGSGVYHVIVDHVSDNNFDPDYTVGGERVYSLLIAVPNPAPVINVSAAYLVLSADHANAYVRCSNASGTIVYIEAGTFDPPTEIHFRQVTGGGISFAYGDSGTFINPPAGCDISTDEQGATVCLKCVGANEFDLIGNCAQASG
jgi:hypothetical protein